MQKLNFNYIQNKILFSNFLLLFLNPTIEQNLKRLSGLLARLVNFYQENYKTNWGWAGPSSGSSYDGVNFRIISAYLVFCLSVYLSICISAYLSNCQSFYLFIHPLQNCKNMSLVPQASFLVPMWFLKTCRKESRQANFLEGCFCHAESAWPPIGGCKPGPGPLPVRIP